MRLFMTSSCSVVVLECPTAFVSRLEGSGEVPFLAPAQGRSIYWDTNRTQAMEANEIKRAKASPLAALVPIGDQHPDRERTDLAARPARSKALS
jgi:hypothetical protein